MSQTPLTVTNAVLDGERIGLRAVDGTITALGRDVVADPGDEILDADGLALVPGLVNGHTHAAMTLFRGYGDDLPLMEWLETRIWPAEAKLTTEDVYWGTRLACLEMIRSGTVHFWDMYWHQLEVGRAVIDSGIRATVGQPILELPGAPDGARPEHAAEGLAELRELGPRVRAAITPHAPYTVSEPSLRLVAEISAAHQTPVHTHLSETEQEVHDSIDAHGCRPPEYLDRLGLLNERSVLAHGVWLDENDLALIAARGATIVTNPVSNMKLAVGRAFPYSSARAAGIPVGIGTDGAASNDSLDLLADVKVLALLQKHATRDPSVVPAAEAWALATGAHAPALGGRPVAVGEPADFLLIDTTGIEMTPAPLVEALIYASSSAAVDTVVVDGRVLMRHRRIDDEAEVRARCGRRPTGYGSRFSRMTENDIDYSERLPVSPRAGDRAGAAARPTSSSNTRAPATPEWRTRDVLAHLTGVTTDVLTGNIDGVATDPWTQAQVDARRELPVADLVAEWEKNGPEIDPMIPSFGAVAGQFLADSVTHEHDIRGALGVPGERESTALAIGFNWLGDRITEMRDAANVGALRVETEAGTYTFGGGEISATCATTRFEFARASTGRRSVEQIAAWEWDGELRSDLIVMPIFSAAAGPAGRVALHRESESESDSASLSRIRAVSRKSSVSSRAWAASRSSSKTSTRNPSSSAMCGIQPPASPYLPDAWIPLASSRARAASASRREPKLAAWTIFPLGRGSRAIDSG